MGVVGGIWGVFFLVFWGFVYLWVSWLRGIWCLGGGGLTWGGPGISISICRYEGNGSSSSLGGLGYLSMA